MLDKIVSEFRAISVQEAREMARLSSGSLRRLLRQGRIEGRRVGRAWAVDALSLFTYLLAAWSPQDLSGHTAHLLNCVTAHYLPRDRFDQAEALLKQLLAAYEVRFGREHPHTFPVLASLAKVYARPNQFAEAIMLFQRLLTLQEKQLGPDHPAVISTLHSLAKIAFEQDDYREVEQYSLRALRLAEQLPEPEQSMVAVLLDELADIYALQDQHRQAEALLKRAIGIDERVCGLEHPQTIRLLCHLAHLYVDLGDIAQARPLYERVLRIAPRPNMSCLDDLYDFIQLCLQQGEDAQADAFMQHVLTLVEPGFGPADEQLVSHCYDLAHLYQEQRRYAQAEALYQRALPKAEHVTLIYVDTAMILSDLAHLYAKQRRYAEAEPLYQRALALREQTSGLDDPTPATLRQALLQLYLAQKNDVEAEELELGPGHPDLIPMLTTLAHFYAQRQHDAEAAHLFKRIAFLYEHQAEPDALSLFVTLINLVGLAMTRKDEGELRAHLPRVQP